MFSVPKLYVLVALILTILAIIMVIYYANLSLNTEGILEVFIGVLILTFYCVFIYPERDR